MPPAALAADIEELFVYFVGAIGSVVTIHLDKNSTN